MKNKIPNPNIGCNHKEHKQWNRRSFLQAMGIASGSAFTLGHSSIMASQPNELTNAINNADTDRVMVIVRLGGGNDGLNTIIPTYDYDIYKSKRPNIGFEQNEITAINDDLAIPNYATGLESLWGEGKMKVILGVGYENSSLSHFKGSDIWAKATKDPQEGSGWLGRYYQHVHPDFLFEPPEKPAAVVIGGRRLEFNDGDVNYAFSVGSPNKLEAIGSSGNRYEISSNEGGCLYQEKLNYIRSTTNNTYSYAKVISEAYKSVNNAITYTDNKLAKQLKIVARLIKGNLGTKVYYVTLGGFDTHNNQRVRHEALITDLSNAIKEFYEDLADAGWDDKVVSLTISEFGRRLKENGSEGTDHGAGSCSMLFGPVFNDNGVIGTHPDLSATDRRGNLVPNTDFKQLYFSVLKDWIGVEDSVIDNTLLQQKVDYLDMDFERKTLSNLGFTSQDKFTYEVYYQNENTLVNIYNEKSAHIDVSLYDLAGNKVVTLKNEFVSQGNILIDIRSQFPHVYAGLYILRVMKSDQNYSKKIMLY